MVKKADKIADADAQPPEEKDVTPPTVVVEEPKEDISKSLQVTETGSVALQSIADQTRFAKRLIDLKMVSDTFKTPQQLVVGFQYAKDLKIPVMLAVKMMYVIKGKPSLYGDGPLLLCQRTGLVSKIREFFIDEKMEEICVKNKNLKAKVWGAVTQVWRKGDDTMQEDFFTLEDLARAKMDMGSNGRKEVWEKYERNMMRYKSRSLALKTKFADLIGGISIAEHDDDFSPETPEILQEKKDAAKELNEAYSDSGQATT